MNKLIALTVPGPGGGPITIPAPTGILSNGGDTNKVAQWIIGITILALVMLALSYLIYGAVMWITSQGDKQKLESARKTIVYAIVGLVLTLFAFIIVQFIGNVFGVNLLNVSV